MTIYPLHDCVICIILPTQKSSAQNAIIELAIDVCALIQGFI